MNELKRRRVRRIYLINLEARLPRNVENAANTFETRRKITAKTISAPRTIIIKLQLFKKFDS